MNFSSLIIFVFLLVAYLCYYVNRRSSLGAKPGFKRYPILGSFPDLIRNRHQLLDWSTEILRGCPTNTAVFFRPGTIHDIITANPANVEHILKTNFENYPKGDRFLSIIKDFLGDGIFNADGKLWKVQRKIASHEFNTKSLRSFMVEIVGDEIRNRLVPLLKHASASNRVLDLQDVWERFAFDNICKVAFDYDARCLLAGEEEDGDDRDVVFMHAFDVAATLSFERFISVFPALYKLKRLLNVGSEKRLRKAIRTVHEFTGNVIQSRLNKAKTEDDDDGHMIKDLLSRFMATHGYSVEFLRDVATSFIMAGRDTTSSGLTWFFYAVSSRPDVLKKIRAELQAIRRSGDKDVEAAASAAPMDDDEGNDYGYTFDQLREASYLHATIMETLRLHPPVPVDVRACLADDVLPDGTVVRKGWFASYFAYSMGRMENIWGKDYEEFVPERWLEKGVFRPENQYRFPVFHAGPRICLGKEMAFIQMKSVAAAVLDKFDVELVERSKCPEYVLALTLRMKGGLAVRVRPRSA